MKLLESKQAPEIHYLKRGDRYVQGPILRLGTLSAGEEPSYTPATPRQVGCSITGEASRSKRVQDFHNFTLLV